MGINQEQNQEITGGKGEELFRLTINKAAEDALGRALNQVNDGFEAGRINRTQIGSWIIQKFVDRLSESDLNQMRADHFDAVICLESVLKRAKEGGVVPSELLTILQSQTGLNRPRRGRKPRNLTFDFINDENKNKGKKPEIRRSETNTGEAEPIA